MHFSQRLKDETTEVGGTHVPTIPRLLHRCT